MKRTREEDRIIIPERSIFYAGREWLRGKNLGQGGFGSVHLALFPRPSTEDRFRGFPTVQGPDRLRGCPSVVWCLGEDVTVAGNDSRLILNMFLEYASGGTLLNLVKSAAPGVLLETQARRFTRSLVPGLAEWLGHCDIKLDNVLLFDDDGGLTAKIADFGLAKRAAEGGVRKGVCGTARYWAPEVVRDRVQGQPADVWALGCVVLGMLTGVLPQRDGGLLALPCGVFSSAVERFMRKCFRRNPDRRPSAAELLRHPFVCEDWPDQPPRATDLGNENTDFIPISDSSSEEDDDDDDRLDEERIMKPNFALPR